MQSLTLFLALTSIGVLAQRVSKDATCGGSTGNTCFGSTFGNCCSQYGWCGSSDLYCGKGCNAKFGKCNQATVVSSIRSSSKTSTSIQISSPAPAPSTLSVSTDSRCGSEYGGKTCSGSLWGDCCSQYNWCGSSKDHCAASTCQKGFGKCNNISSSKVNGASSIARSSSKASSVAASVSSSSLNSVKTSPASQAIPSVATTTKGSASIAQSSTGSSAAGAGMSSSTSVIVLASTGSSSDSSSSTSIASIQSSGSSSTSSSFISSLSLSTAPSSASSFVSSTESPAIVSSSDIASAIVTSQSSSMVPSSSINNDSPPFTPTASVIFPTDPEKFLSTYTFQDDALPTPVEMGSPPIATGVSPNDANLVKTCLITPGKPDASFQMLDPKDRVPLTKRADGTLGPPIAPKSEAEFKAMGPIEDLKFTSFVLVSSASGLFDLVTNESPRQYVAKKSDGSVTLIDQPTNGAQLATTIFDVTCEGRITVLIGSQHYTWTMRESDSVMETADGTPDTMYTLPDSSAATKRRRRNKSQEGAAPRCNAYPSPLDAREFPGRRDNNPNKCGSSSFKVPDLSFGNCCDQHDNDYDDCSKTFEEGNDRFRSCMRGSGCDSLNHWYSYLPYVACLRTADFYYSVVASWAGQIAFYKSNTDRCRCYCTGSTPHGCMVNGQFQCLNVLGSDTNNCGGCGRKCPQGSRCEGGQCKCPAEQCGDRCVTLASHPKNCGSCGRVSLSGYCVQGQPYTPPAFCSRGNGFRNGNFAAGGSDWTGQIVSGGSNSRFDVGGDGGAEDADRMVGILSLYSPNPGANLKTSVKMCPGTTYILGFQIRRPYGTDNCAYAVYVAGELKNNGNVPQPANTGAGWMWVSGLRVGPFFGERAGVTAAGPELWAEFQLQIRCSGGAPYDFIRMDQFTMNPI